MPKRYFGLASSSFVVSVLLAHPCHALQAEAVNRIANSYTGKENCPGIDSASFKTIQSVEKVAAASAKRYGTPLNKALPEKDEFESTDEWQRKRDLNFQKYFSDTNTIYVVAKMDSSDVSYNADDQILDVKMPSNENRGIGLYGRTIPNGTYKAHTALNVPFTVEVTNEYSISAELEGELPESGSLYLPMDAATAKLTKPALYIIVKGALSGKKYESTYNDGLPARLDKQFETKWFHQNYYITPSCIYLYDASRGKTLRTYPDRGADGNFLTTRRIRKGYFLKYPSASILADIYPEKALNDEVSSSVKVHCIVQTDGGLNQCKAISESTPGYGFGEAVVKMLTENAIMDMQVHTPGQTIEMEYNFNSNF